MRLSTRESGALACFPQGPRSPAPFRCNKHQFILEANCLSLSFHHPVFDREHVFNRCNKRGQGKKMNKSIPGSTPTRVCVGV